MRKFNGEIFRSVAPVYGGVYIGAYMVSNWGRVASLYKSCAYKNGTYKIVKRIAPKEINQAGTPQAPFVNLSTNRVKHSCPVSDLMEGIFTQAELSVPKPSDFIVARCPPYIKKSRSTTKSNSWANKPSLPLEEDVEEYIAAYEEKLLRESRAS